MSHLKESGQAVGAQVMTELTGFAPPTIMAQASRLQSRQRFFNLVVTNVPGPQFPLYLLGRRMDAVYPMVPLAANQALGVAIMSYDGKMNFGLNADFDVVPDSSSWSCTSRRRSTSWPPPRGSPRRREAPAEIGNGGPPMGSRAPGAARGRRAAAHRPLA